MNGKSIPNRSSLSFSVPDGMIDLDHIRQLEPWKQAEKFNTTEMNCIQNVLNEFNDMVLDRKHMDRKRRSVGKENVSASNNNGPKSSKPASEKSGTKSMDRKRGSVGGESVSASNNNEPKSSKPANEKSGRNSMDGKRRWVRKESVSTSNNNESKSSKPSGKSGRHSIYPKKNGGRSGNTDTNPTGEKCSQIPRPRQTIGEKTESNGKDKQRKQESKPKNGNSVNKAPKTSNNRTSNVRSALKTDRKENIQANKPDATKKGEKKSSKPAQLAEGKRKEVGKVVGKVVGKGASNFRELPKRKDSQPPVQISVKSAGGQGNSSTAEKKRRRVQRRESLIINKEKTVTVKQEQISMLEESNCDMTFDSNALVNSTMSSHAPVSAMSSARAVMNTANYSYVQKTTKTSKRIVESSAARAGTPKLAQIKQEEESPVSGKEEKTTKVEKVEAPKKVKIEAEEGKKCLQSTKKSREDKPRAKVDRSKRRDSKECTRRIRGHESGAKRAIEEFSHHVVSIAKGMGYLTDIDFSDDDSLSDSDCSACSSCSSCSSYSYSTHSEYCSCGECTSCSSDEYSEYTLCSCSGCSCCDSTSATDDSKDNL